MAFSISPIPELDAPATPTSVESPEHSRLFPAPCRNAPRSCKGCSVCTRMHTHTHTHTHTHIHRQAQTLHPACSFFKIQMEFLPWPDYPFTLSLVSRPFIRTPSAQISLKSLSVGTGPEYPVAPSWYRVEGFNPGARPSGKLLPTALYSLT